MRKLVVTSCVLAVIGGLLIGADRLAVHLAEGEIAKQVAAQSGLAAAGGEQPVVDIAGFPFLTQVLTGEYDEITMTVGEVTQRGVTLTEVRSTLRDVRAPLGAIVSGDVSQVAAGAVEVSAILPFSVVDKHAPRGVQVSGDGSGLRLRGRVSYGGISAPVDATVTVKAGRRGITVTPQRVRGAGGRDIPIALVQRQFGFTVPLRDLPMGARVTEADVVSGGLRITAVADDVKLTG